jgi:hypothetical protein
MRAVQFPVCAAMFDRLCGFKGFPRQAGLVVFIEALCDAAVSVKHAQAVIDSFDEGFPTLRELRDTAHSLRAKFETVQSDREKWEAEYGPPDPEWSKNLLTQAMRSSRRDDELWRLLREKFPECGKNRKEWPSWPVLAKAVRELGPHDPDKKNWADYVKAWE